MVKIIVEGNDDKNLLTTLLRKLELGDKNKLESYILSMGGKAKLLDCKQQKYEKITEKIKLNKITKVLFIFDCDFKKDDNECGGYDKSEECFQQLKKDLNWNIEVDYYIFDKNLDYFLIESLPKKKECFIDFEKCLDLKEISPNRKPIANLYRNLYPNNPYDFSHQNFNELKQKLRNLFSII